MIVDFLVIIGGKQHKINWSLSFDDVNAAIKFINKQNLVNRKEENLQSGTAKVCHKLLAEINFYSLEEEAHIHISNWKEVVKYVLLFQSFSTQKKSHQVK